MEKKKPAILSLLAVLLLGFWLGFQSGKSVAPVPTDIDALTQDSLSTSESVPYNQAVATVADSPQFTDSKPSESDQPVLDEDGSYDSKDKVALYLVSYGHLPSNYVTKKAAREAGWNGGPLDRVFPGCSIGGDVFRNREGLLPKAPGRTYFECDINATGKQSRGAKRIVYSNDGLIYYTEDHYESFTLLYGKED